MPAESLVCKGPAAIWIQLCKLPDQIKVICSTSYGSIVRQLLIFFNNIFLP